MYLLEIYLKLHTQVLVNDVEWITNYIFSFYSDSQKEAFVQDSAQCVAAGIMVALDDEQAYRDAGVQHLTIDTENNSLTLRYLLHDPQRFCSTFVNDWDTNRANAYEPIRAYFENHPEEGEHSFKIFNDQGVDVTHIFYDQHPENGNPANP